MPKDMQITKPPAELAAEWAPLGPHLLVCGRHVPAPPDWENAAAPCCEEDNQEDEVIAAHESTCPGADAAGGTPERTELQIQAAAEGPAIAAQVRRQLTGVATDCAVTRGALGAGTRCPPLCNLEAQRKHIRPRKRAAAAQPCTQLWTVCRLEAT